MHVCPYYFAHVIIYLKYYVSVLYNVMQERLPDKIGLLIYILKVVQNLKLQGQINKLLHGETLCTLPKISG